MPEVLLMATTIVLLITRPVVSEKVCIVGTYGSVGELVNTAIMRIK